MKKVGAISFLLICSSLFYSFSYQEGEEYKQRNYYDLKCNCYVYEVYFPNGKLFMLEQFSDSFNRNRNGQSIFFYETGDTAEVTTFLNGKMEGYSYNKSPNGVISARRYYSKGILDTFMLYDEEGKLTQSTMYSDIDRIRIDIHKVRKQLPSGDSNVIADYEDSHNSKLKLASIDSLLYTQMLDSPAKRTGKQLFAQNCAMCHNPYKDAVGPKLVGVTKRRSDKWIRSWIRNSSKMIADGDKQAVALYSEWHKTAMSSFADLSKEDMNKLMDYLASL